MKLFDLHCDTLSEIYCAGESLDDNSLHISKKKAQQYEKYAQLFAIWSRHDLEPDENFAFFKQILKYSKKYLDSTDSFTPYLAVEGGALLNGDISRLDYLHSVGVRFLTLVWGGSCCIGGAHDTDEGLTHFGRDVVERCLEIGIVPDLSHASDKVFYEAYSIALEHKGALICTHSNSRSVCDHRRNLTDEMFGMIRDIGGIVGISLCRPHLCESGECKIDDVVRHIEKYLSLGGEKTVCLGCDLDGIGRLPDGMENVSDLYKIADAMSAKNYSDSLIEDIFYYNAFRFMEKHCILPFDNKNKNI